nr:ribonuclease H family protein [uncultured Capnocytophaga sp.]
MAKKYYTVWEGYNIGVFSSWEECKKNISGYPTAKYKSFPTKEQAQKALNENYWEHVGKKNTPAPLPPSATAPYDTHSIAVDAACSGNPGTMYYRAIDLSTGTVYFSQGPFLRATNNIGEFLAIVHALAQLSLSGDTRTIYSDSKIAISWVKQKRCKTKLPVEPANKKVFELIERAEKWLHTHTYSNPILKWETQLWGEIPADYGNKK